MNIVSTNMTVADYCTAMDRNEIVVNRNYQRSDQIWPAAAKSYLIETILTGFPIPKLSLYQKVDLRSKRTFKEIVDGQQRSTTVKEFLNENLALSQTLKTTEIAGKMYGDLDPEFQQRFLDYSLSIDLFVSASPSEVIEVFRRMNSYTVPLNPEEQRHAEFQGRFKWFINRMAERFEPSFIAIGLFNEKQLVRMGDNKLLTEICHALVNGISTTNKKSLDSLYRQKDEKFPEEDDFSNRLTEAVDELSEWRELAGTSLMKPYVVYSLLLAITHCHRRVTKLSTLFASPNRRRFDKSSVITNLSRLAQAIEEGDENGRSGAFVRACIERTNVKDQRETRFEWLCRALAA
jgi:hypothetical protein